jgi:hypothetical protein
MSDQPLGREEVARIAIALKGLDEYRETPLNDLIETSIWFLQRCGRALEPENLDSTAPLKGFSRQEAARMVTGNRRAKRAMQQFDRYLEFISNHGPKPLWEEGQEDNWPYVQYSLEGLKKDPDRFDEVFCNELKEKFSEWRNIDLSNRQSLKAKKPRKKSLRRDVAKNSKPQDAK